MKYSARHVSYLNNTRSLKKCCKLETKRILILDQIGIEKKTPKKPIHASPLWQRKLKKITHFEKFFIVR